MPRRTARDRRANVLQIVLEVSLLVRIDATRFRPASSSPLLLLYPRFRRPSRLAPFAHPSLPSPPALAGRMKGAAVPPCFANAGRGSVSRRSISSDARPGDARVAAWKSRRAAHSFLVILPLVVLPLLSLLRFFLNHPFGIIIHFAKYKTGAMISSEN